MLANLVGLVMPIGRHIHWSQRWTGTLALSALTALSVTSEESIHVKGNQPIPDVNLVFIFFTSIQYGWVSHEPLGSTTISGRVDNAAVPNREPWEATKGSRESATERSDLSGWRLERNCLWRRGLRWVGEAQLGRSNAVKSSEPTSDRLLKP